MSKKILIVEDERDVAKLLRYNLEKEGFRVSCVSDGSLALAEMRREDAHMVILDLMLPGNGRAGNLPAAPPARKVREHSDPDVDCTK
jgi:DNA-binding response OmpR family regulator